MDQFPSPSPADADDRDQLKANIRKALERFPEFTSSIIDAFLQKIEQLELGLREALGAHENLLCRERVDVLLNFLEEDPKLFALALKTKPMDEVVEGFLTALATQQEYTAGLVVEQAVYEGVRQKFLRLNGVTADQVEKLIRSIEAICQSFNAQLSDELLQPVLAIDDREIEGASRERGAEKIFPEIVTSFHRYMKRAIEEQN